MTATNFPASAPVVGPDGRLSPVWMQFFQTIFARTGGTSDMTDAEAVALPRARRGDAEQPTEVMQPRAHHARKQEERAPARRVQPRLYLTKEAFKPLTLIRLYVGVAGDIPAGWQLADGTNGTPDMRDKFVVGSGSLYGQGTAGGSTTITADNLPAHQHPYSDKDTTYTVATSGAQSGSSFAAVTAITAGGGDTARTTGNNATAATPYLPPYYAAAYIINTKTVTFVTDATLR